VFTPPLPLWFLILTSLFIGLVVGALIGVLASLLLGLKIQARDIVIDAILGALGFDIAWTIVLLIPWRNTITYRVDHTVVTSTMSHYQHPDLLAYIAAMLFPVLHEIHRFRRLRATRVN
jgi:H+/Cl- antiporter ClcA